MNMNTLSDQLVDETYSLNERMKAISEFIKTPLVVELVHSLEELTTKIDGCYCYLHLLPSSLYVNIVLDNVNGFEDERRRSLLALLDGLQPDSFSHHDIVPDTTREYVFTWKDPVGGSSATVRITMNFLKA